MSIKIYNINGMGLVIGEKISQDNEFVYLEYPGIFIQQVSQRGERHDSIIEAVPPVFNGRDEMLERLPLKKAMIIYGGQPIPQMIELYEQYVARLKARISGIQIVGANAMPRQPEGIKK